MIMGVFDDDDDGDDGNGGNRDGIARHTLNDEYEWHRN